MFRRIVAVINISFLDLLVRYSNILYFIYILTQLNSDSEQNVNIILQ